MSDARATLRIVSVLTTHAAGGAEYAAVDMLDALARRGHDVQLLTDRPELVRGTSLTATRIDLGPKLRRRTAARVALTAPLLQRRLRRALRDAAPFDVLLVHFKKEELLSVTLPRALAPRVVWAEWGPLPVAMRGRPWAALYRLAARRADVLLAESPRTRASLTAAGVDPARIVVVPNVLDDHGLRYDAAGRSELRARWHLGDAFVLACLSRLDAEKRVDVAIDALAHLDADTVLLVAGTGRHEEALRRRAAAYGDRVRFVGDVRGRVAQVLSAADVQVYAPGPSEGAARAVTMGQFVGVPVVATAPEGTHGLLGPGCGTVVAPPNDARALARTLDAYRQDPERRRAEAQTGRARALERILAADALTTLESALRSAEPDAAGEA